MQNGRGKHAVPPLRAAPNAESNLLNAAVRGKSYENCRRNSLIETAVKRIGKMKKDPLACADGEAN
jgi:hypothetical protein